MRDCLYHFFNSILLDTSLWYFLWTHTFGFRKDCYYMWLNYRWREYLRNYLGLNKGRFLNYDGLNFLKEGLNILNEGLDRQLALKEWFLQCTFLERKLNFLGRHFFIILWVILLLLPVVPEVIWVVNRRGALHQGLLYLYGGCVLLFHWRLDDLIVKVIFIVFLAFYYINIVFNGIPVIEVKILIIIRLDYVSMKFLASTNKFIVVVAVILIILLSIFIYFELVGFFAYGLRWLLLEGLLLSELLVQRRQALVHVHFVVVIVIVVIVFYHYLFLHFLVC